MRVLGLKWYAHAFAWILVLNGITGPNAEGGIYGIFGAIVGAYLFVYLATAVVRLLRGVVSRGGTADGRERDAAADA